MRESLLILVGMALLSGCHKTSAVEPPSPKLGTKWTYRYKKFNAAGSVQLTRNVIYTASSVEGSGSDEWLVIADSTGASVFILAKKNDGLYQNPGTALLLCKDPAVEGDSYIIQNNGADEAITVMAKDSIVSVPFGDIATYRYEGQQGGNLKDIIWYNSAVWFAKKEVYILNTFTGLNHVDTRLELVDLTY